MLVKWFSRKKRKALILAFANFCGVKLPPLTTDKCFGHNCFAKGTFTCESQTHTHRHTILYKCTYYHSSSYHLKGSERKSVSWGVIWTRQPLLRAHSKEKRSLSEITDPLLQERLNSKHHVFYWSRNFNRFSVSSRFRAMVNSIERGRDYKHLQKHRPWQPSLVP